MHDERHPTDDHSAQAGSRPEARRVVRRFVHGLEAPPERVFPLLCPLREREWVPGWMAKIIYSRSGSAEDHCVFQTASPGGGLLTWVISHFDPARFLIGFTILCPDRYVERLDIELEPDGTGTRAIWTRTYTGLNEAGQTLLEAQTGPSLDTLMAGLHRALAYFLATGQRIGADASVKNG